MDRSVCSRLPDWEEWADEAFYREKKADSYSQALILMGDFTTVSVGGTIQQSISNPADSWNTLMITFFSKWWRSQQEEVLCWTSFSKQEWSCWECIGQRQPWVHLLWTGSLRFLGQCGWHGGNSQPWILGEQTLASAGIYLVDKVLEGRGTHESWLIIKDQLLSMCKSNVSQQRKSQKKKLHGWTRSSCPNRKRRPTEGGSKDQ